MRAIATTEPDSDPALQRRITEARSDLAEATANRERAAGFVAAGAFLATATAMALLIESPRSLDPWLALALVATYAYATRIEFDMGSVWTDPSQLVLVPMLFLLPTPLVPLFVAAALLLSRVPDYRTGAVHPARAALRVADAWNSVWPALVLALAGATSPDWGDWPIYLAALGAQSGLDLAVTLLRLTGGVGVPARAVVDELRAVYLVDALLAPIGLLAAFAAVTAQWTFVLVVPLIWLIGVFARERRARIENALALSSAYRGTAHLLGEVLSSTHEYTGSHSRSVVVLAHQVGVALAVDEGTLREIEFGALLHDVGKMSVPNEILNKPGSLTDEEMEVVRRHTLAGERMLDRIGGVLAEVGHVVRSHHERYDGGGYPDRLGGDEIPLAARVIAACDAFHAMISERPYRRPMTIDEAVAELRANSGTQFDPGVVETLASIVAAWGPEPLAGAEAPAEAPGVPTGSLAAR